MRKYWCCSLFVLLLFSVVIIAFGEGTVVEFNVEQYSLEELREINTLVDERLTVLEREWAIEHGDRTITFDEDNLILFTGRTQKTSPTITRITDDAPEKTSLLWSSSDDSIAKVTSEGSIKGVAKGDAIITATAKDNDCIMGTIAVHVVLPVSKVTAEETDATLLLNDNPADAEKTLQVVIEPEDAYVQGVIWSSSKEDIVSIDENGHITGLAPGKSTITAKSAEEGSEKKASINVTVVRAVGDIVLSETTLVMDKGKTARLKADVRPEDATQKGVTWSTSDEEIAKVSSDGTITAKSCGECDIICTSKDGSDVSSNCHVVIKQLVKAIKLSDSQLVLPRGESQQVDATILPDDATEKAVEWISSDPSIAEVSDNGTITAVNGGDCEISCLASDGSEIQTAVSVHVPAFSVDNSNCLIDSMVLDELPVKLVGITMDDIAIDVPSKIVTAEIVENGIIRLFPVDSGKGKLKITCINNKVDIVNVDVEVTNNAICDLQEMLTNLEVYSANLTGKMDQKTKSAVSTAQEMLGLQSDGIVSEEFISSLKEALILSPKALEEVKPLSEVFPDEYLAMAVRNSLGFVSISQSVTQEDLDKCTSLTITDGPVNSLAGVEYLRNLVKFKADCQSGWHFSNRNTTGPCNSASLTVNSIRALMACKKLEYISIHGAPFTRIPHEIGDLANLETLVIEYGCFTSIPDEICQCTNLSILAFEKCPLKSIPENIGNLTNITQLRLKGTRISELPDSIGNMTRMTSLLCENSDFITLPDSIGSLVALSKIDLSGNIYLESLPETMNKLINLNDLDLSSCKKLKSLPAGLQEILMNNNAKINLEKTSIK